MKKTLALTLTAMILGFSAKAQTNVPPPTSIFGTNFDQAIAFVTTGSNWMVAPYMTFADNGKSFGGGLGIGYKVSNFLVPTLRLDYLNGKVFMPSGNLQLQLPITLFNKFIVVPFAFTGIATPVMGLGNDNMTPVGIVGAGAAVRIGTKWDIIADYEHWTNDRISGQVRVGFVYKF